MVAVATKPFVEGLVTGRAITRRPAAPTMPSIGARKYHTKVMGSIIALLYVQTILQIQESILESYIST